MIVLGSSSIKINYGCISSYFRRKRTMMGSHTPPSLYLDPPDHDISLDEFVTLPKRRLEAIRLLRSGEIAVEPEDFNTVDARQLLLHGHSDRPSDAEHRRADIASHFILKLACCGASKIEHEGKGRRDKQDDADSVRDSSRREWFARAEKDLFRARLHWYVQGAGDSGSVDQEPTSSHKRTEYITANERCEALRIVYELGWLQSITLDTDRLDSEDVHGTGVNGNGFGCRRYLSCPFERVPGLVKSRRVLLRDGKAFLKPRQVPVAVVHHFVERLRHGMAVAERCLPGVETDERVARILREVRRDVDASIYGRSGMGTRHDQVSASSVVITKDNIDDIAGRHFPLCMRRALSILRRDHHLKYQARIQLVGFLANAGMEVGEVLGIWREEFPKGMLPADYARKRNQYEYSLRHIYGLEGKRKMARPQSCSRVASSGWSGSGEGGFGHGCPFYASRQPPGSRNGTGESPNRVILREMLLAEEGLSTVDIEDIVRPLEGGGGCGSMNSAGPFAGLGSAVSACSKHVSATHRWEAGSVAWGDGSELEASPNGWFVASNRSRPEDGFACQQAR